MRCVDATPLFLGFGLQLLQVGMIPLIGADLRLSTAAASWLVTSSLLAGIVFLALLSRLADFIGKVPVIALSLGLVLTFQNCGSTAVAPSLEASRIAHLFGGSAAVAALLLCLPLWQRPPALAFRRKRAASGRQVRPCGMTR